MRKIDRRNVAMGRYAALRRPVAQITRIAIHHSASGPAGNNAVFENYWRTRGWTVGGYHEIILHNGDWELCYNPEQITWGVGNHNHYTYHICIVGNFRVNGASPSAVQMRTLFERLRINMQRFNLSVNHILGHNEFSGHASNSCPGINMNNLRQQMQANIHIVRSGETLSHIALQYQTTVAELIRLNNITNSNMIRVGQQIHLPHNRITNGDLFVVTRATGGFNTALDARNNLNQRATVLPGTYYVFNRAEGMVNVTRVRGVPGSWINPTGQTTTTNNALRVGSRVRVNNNAMRWATGETIPAWVRGGTYTVQQLRTRGGVNEVLLAELLSWIRATDVTVV